LFRPEFAYISLPSHPANILQKSFLPDNVGYYTRTSIVKCRKIMAAIIVTPIVMKLRPCVYNCSSSSRLA